MKQCSLPSSLVRVASLYFEGLGTPYSVGVAAMLRQEDWDGISELSPDPRSYLEHEWERFARDSAAAGLLRKMVDLPTSHDRVAKAMEKWWQGEHDCKRTNLRLEPYLPSPLLPELRDPGINRVVRLIRQEVLRLVGPRPSASAEGRFGPGATYTDRGGLTTVPDKMTSDPSLTRDAIWYLPQWLGTQWGAAVAQRHGELSFVPGNRFSTAPKNAKTDRSIAVEPALNVFFQLAVGRQIRHRLATRGGWDILPGGAVKRRYRWDLDRAQDLHRQVAERSSVTREFATLDLSNASDTVSRNLVKLLMPHAWYDVLDDLRSKKTCVQGKWVCLEKFSSMGNGFTFELETLLFSAISIVVSREVGHEGILGKDVFVFGDDIIVKDDVTHPLKSVLEFLGFRLNEEKSFWGGVPFRESCGGDYFAGNSVRPFFLKAIPNEPQEHISFANGLRKVANQLDPHGSFGSSTLRRAWFSVLDCIPTGIRRCRGPQALGDIVITDDPERWTTRWRGDIRYLRVYRPARYKVVHYGAFRPAVVLACATYGCGIYRGGVIPRDGVRGYKVGWMSYS